MKEVELSKIAEVFGGYAFKSKDFNEISGVPVIKISNIQGGEVSEKTLKEYLPESYLDNYANYQIRRGDILVALSGATTGKTGVYNLDSKSLLNQRVGLVRAKNGQAEQKYLSYYVSKITDDILNKAQGVAQPNISTKELAKFKIPLPTLSEQKAIVAKLDRAQRLIDIDQEMLAKYDELIQSVFLEMFGDPVTNPKGWERVVFSKIFDIATGKLNANAAVENGEYPFFTCSREISWIDDYAFDTEALLLAGNNASGDFNIKHYKGKFNAYQRTYVLTSEWNYGFLKIALDYFLNQMKSDSIGTNTKYLTLKLLDRISIPIPPIDLQNKFNDVVSKIDEEKRIVNQEQIKKSEELFSSLVKGAFG